MVRFVPDDGITGISRADGDDELFVFVVLVPSAARTVFEHDGIMGNQTDGDIPVFDMLRLVVGLVQQYARGHRALRTRIPDMDAGSVHAVPFREVADDDQFRSVMRQLRGGGHSAFCRKLDPPFPFEPVRTEVFRKMTVRGPGLAAECRYVVDGFALVYRMYGNGREYQTER